MAATKVKKTSKKKALSTKVKAKKTKATKKVVRKAKAKAPSKLRKLLNSVKNAVHLSSEPKKKPPIERVDNPFNKSQLLTTLAERTELSKKYASSMLEELFHIMGVHLKKGGPEKFVFPGAFKIVVRKMPARKARTGVNPFTGQPTTFKAKPASRRVKIIPLKALKEMAHK